MSSVSVLPPHPPLMSAARKLALALAESAQKASGCPQRRHTYTPPHPLLLPRQEAPLLPHGTGQDRPPRPSMLDLKVYLQGSSHSPAKGLRYPPPGHFLPAHLQPDGQESSSNFTPNVSPLGSGSLDESRDDLQLEDMLIEPTYQSVGVSTPTQPVCPTQSPLTSPVYVNTDSINVFNFRAVLAETSMPTSIEQVLPRPLHRQYSAEEDNADDYSYLIQKRQTPRCPPPEALPIHLQKSIYRQSSEGHYSALASRYPLSPQNRRYYKDEHAVSGFHRSNSQQQRSDDRVAGQPAIRRARSFHAPQISHYELAEAEIMPPDTIFYVETPSSQDTIYSRLIESGWHPSSQLENDQRHKRYQGESSQYYAEPCQPTGIRHSQSYTLHSTRESEQSDYYAKPINRELFIEQDTVVYEARDSEVYERVVYQPYRDKGKSSYDSPGSRNRDIMHTRSKSDPGNAYLLCADRMENVQAAATSPTSPLSQQSESEVSKHQVSYRSSVEPSQTRRIHIKESSAQQLHKVPSHPERACPNLKNVEHKSHIQGYNQDPLMMAKATGYSGILKPGILRRPGRSQSTRESRPHHQYQVKSPVDSEHLGAFSQAGRRTQSYKVRPTQHDFTEGFYAAPRSKPVRTNKALAGFVQGQGCMTPNRHRLLSKALGREGYYLRSEGGVYD